MKKAPVAIGYLERFAADAEIARGDAAAEDNKKSNGIRVAVAGSGLPACHSPAKWLVEVSK